MIVVSFYLFDSTILDDPSYFDINYENSGYDIYMYVWSQDLSP